MAKDYFKVRQVSRTVTVTSIYNRALEAFRNFQKKVFCRRVVNNCFGIEFESFENTYEKKLKYHIGNHYSKSSFQ